MNGNGDFEVAVRTGLATLAREAVPETSEPVITLPPVRPVPVRYRRRFDVRLLAAGITIAVATASAAVALSLRGESAKPPLGPRPSWTKVARSPLTPRSSQVAVFTGHDVIVWGGRSDASTNVAPAAGAGAPRYALGDGAAYDVSADRWRVLPRAPIGGRFDAVAVWTGREMLVVGGVRDHDRPGGGDRLLSDGATYDPARRRWRRIADAPGCPRFGAWTGTQLVVGGTCGDVAGARSVFAAYDPARDRWTRLPRFASANQLAAAGGRLYAWERGVVGRGAVYDSSTRRWRPLPTVTDSSNPLQDSVAIAYRDHLAVVGREADPMGNGPDLARAAILGPQGWTTIALAVTPPLGNTVVAAADGAIVWSSALSLGAETIDEHIRSFSLENVGDAPISIDRSGQSIVGIGYRRFFVWGGRLAGTEKDPTNRPTADGAIVQLP